MCGIAGIFDLEAGAPVDRHLLQRMVDVLSHRGPDGEGLHLEPGVGLGHRRLSIIDLATGQQPLANEDDTVWVTFNGEIYNFGPLRAELEAADHAFDTHSDTEVIVHAWEQWGEACVERFNGMFAFALWDRNQGVLLLARDRLGIKPLHYAVTRDRKLVFASELKALLACPGVGRDLDPRSISDYFSLGYVPDPRTIFRDVAKLAPGHVLRVARGAPLAPRRYWDVEPTAGLRGLGDAALEERLRELIDDAVRFRRIAEVPLGAFLSGGVDSSGVVACMARQSADPVRTCSIRFDDPDFNEDRFGALVAARYGTDHKIEDVTVEDFGLLDTLVGVYDEPFADSSAIPTYRVCEMARKLVTVALSGDGGDEVFAGYRRYPWHLREERVRRLLPAALRARVFGTLGRAYPGLAWAPRFLRAKSTLLALAKPSVEGYFESVSILPAELQDALFTPAFRRSLGGYRTQDVLAEAYAAAPAGDALSRAQYADLKTYLPGDILTKVDRASMAHGLEVRVPLLDHRVVNFGLGLDPGQRLRGREGKSILKRALAPLVPRDVLRRRKMGFSVPLARWMSGPLRGRVDAALAGERLRALGIFDERVLKGLSDAHRAGERDHGATLWALLMFDGFLQACERRTAAPPAARVVTPA
jgi:asparagine synthase (glutamine-hydrolysing)